MRRKLLLCSVVVSLALFAAVCTFWVRSHLSEDPDRLIRIPRAYGHWSFESHPGGLLFGEAHWSGGRNDVFFRSALGFNYYSFPGDNYHHSALVVPHWFAAILTALPAAIVGARLWRRSKPRPGHCPTCGYDLRASPGQCPECGATPARGSA